METEQELAEQMRRQEEAEGKVAALKEGDHTEDPRPALLEAIQKLRALRQQEVQDGVKFADELVAMAEYIHTLKTNQDFRQEIADVLEINLKEADVILSKMDGHLYQITLQLTSFIQKYSAEIEIGRAHV
jgi:hypothetical protein